MRTPTRLAALALLAPPAPALAQRSILQDPMRPVPAATAGAAVAKRATAASLLVAEADTARPLSWTLGGNGFAAQNDVTGLGGGLTVRRRAFQTGSFAINVTDQIRRANAASRNVASVSGQIAPFANRKTLKIPITLTAGAQYSITSSVSRDAQLFVELDAVATRNGALVVGPVFYAGRNAPRDGSASSGFVPGLIASWSPDWDHFLVSAEYDGNTRFAGESSYSVISDFTVPGSDATWMRLGYQRHGVVLGGLRHTW